MRDTTSYFRSYSSSPSEKKLEILPSKKRMAKGASHESQKRRHICELPQKRIHHIFDQFSAKIFFFGNPHFKSDKQWVHTKAISIRNPRMSFAT
jgi:hypothetical protein